VPSDSHKYYEMLFMYVDDILAVSHKAKEVIKEVIEEVTAFYKVKEGSIKESEIYLRVNIETIQTLDGCMIWASSPRDYVKNAVKTVERLFEDS